jgi:hypothetical protein
MRCRVTLPGMKGKKPITPAERMARMDAMFEKEHAVLAEDYEFFTGIRYSDMILDAPKSPNKAPRTSGKASVRPNLELN